MHARTSSLFLLEPADSCLRHCCKNGGCVHAVAVEVSLTKTCIRSKGHDRTTWDITGQLGIFQAILPGDGRQASRCSSAWIGRVNRCDFSTERSFALNRALSLKVRCHSSADLPIFYSDSCSTSRSTPSTGPLSHNALPVILAEQTAQACANASVCLTKIARAVSN